MARVELVTWNDLVEHLIDWLGANPTIEARRDAKRASLTALRDVCNAYSWSYFYTTGRLTTVAPYTTGTIEYIHTGGTYERQLTLTGGTWPTWAAQGLIYLGDTLYEVYDRKSSSIITLSINNNPGADIAAGTTYTIFRDNYSLPCNLQSVGEVIITAYSRVLAPEHPSTWLGRRRIWRGTATPYTYCILGDPNFQNTISMAFYPPPDNVYNIDFLYKRRPRQLKIDNYSTGTISAVNGTSYVTGSNTEFTSQMVGSTLRLGTKANAPTSRWGSYQFAEERIVVGYNSATSLSVDAPWESDYTDVKYVISDPIDIDVGSMLTCLLRCSELNTAHARNKSDREQLQQIYMRELLMAREADSRNFKEEAVGRQSVWPVRLANLPFRGNE